MPPVTAGHLIRISGVIREGKMIEVHPSAVIDKTVQLGDGVKIGPNCVIEAGVSIGNGTSLGPNVVIGKNTRIGSDNQLFAGCAIGGRPQVLALKADSPVGGLVIGNNNVIREQVTIHPSMHTDGTTSIGSDNLLMIGVHVGHDCTLEDKIVLSNYVQIAGHCKVETGAWLSGMVAIHQFTTVGKWCYAAGLAGLNHDVPPFLIVSGHYPAKVRGVNKRGLVRAGLTENQQAKVMEAYRKLYRQGGTLLENVKTLMQEDGLDENVFAMTDAIIRSNNHRFGRYLELARH
jgi:UDP-N-acetylglucosamine acyltransferase